MISLDNSKIEIAVEMHAVFQASYSVEAKWLKVSDFPPLRRTITDFCTSKTIFWGFLKNEKIAGVIEIKRANQSIDIQSLVVHPEYFRQGIATQLLDFVLKYYDIKIFTVETGLENAPAIQLYENFGFKEVKQWTTGEGIRKIGFEMIRNSQE